MNNFMFMGTTPVKKGDRIEVLVNDTWHSARVLDALAAQFSATVGKRHVYRLYTDRGVTWKR